MYQNLNNMTATRTLGKENKPRYFPHYFRLVGPHFLPTPSKVYYPESSIKIRLKISHCIKCSVYVAMHKHFLRLQLIQYQTS